MSTLEIYARAPYQPGGEFEINTKVAEHHADEQRRTIQNLPGSKRPPNE